MNLYTTTLEEYQFFKGDTFSIPFIAFYDDGDPIDLRRFEVRLYLFPYGCYEMPVIFDTLNYKVGILSEQTGHENECVFDFKPNDTTYLENNKYVYQPILVFNDGTNREYRRGEGIIIFKSSINTYK